MQQDFVGSTATMDVAPSRVAAEVLDKFGKQITAKDVQNLKAKCLGKFSFLSTPCPLQ